MTSAHIKALNGLRDRSLGTAAILKEIETQGSATFALAFLRLQGTAVAAAVARASVHVAARVIFLGVRYWLRFAAHVSHWCRARSIQLEAFFVDDHPRLIALLRAQEPLPLVADAEAAKSLGGAAVVDLDFGRVLRAMDPNLVVDGPQDSRLVDLLRSPEHSVKLDAALRTALAAGGMRDLDAYVMWDIRVVQSPGVCLVHWDRQYRYAAADGAFQLWIPVFISDAEPAGLLLATDDHGLQHRYDTPLDLRLDGTEVVVQDHISRVEVERHAAAAFKCDLRPARVHLGQALVFNMRCMHSCDPVEAHMRVAVTARYVPKQNFTKLASHFPIASEEFHRCSNFHRCKSAAPKTDDGILRYRLAESNYGTLDNDTAYQIVPCWKSL